MDLKELKKKIYKPGADFQERLEPPESLQPGQPRRKEESGSWPKTKKRGLSPKQRKYLSRSLIWSGAAFLIIIGLLVLHSLIVFDQDKVSLSVEGVERIVSGEQIDYLVKYKNETRLELTQIKLTFHYPENSIPQETEDLVQTIDLPNLPAGQSGQTKLPARIIGLKEEAKKAWAEFSYQPAGVSSVFKRQAESSTTIISVPLILDFDLPEKLVDNQSFDFSLKYLNQSEVSFDDLQIQLEYPDGFTFQSADPTPDSEDRIWSVGDLMAGQQDKIFIQGIIQGEERESRTFKAQLGTMIKDEFTVYAQTIKALQISPSPLSVEQTVNGQSEYIASAGEKLDYKIKYQNTTEVGIRNANIVAELKGRALDLTSLDLENGSFDGQKQTITWKASNLPDLEFLDAYQSGEINFSVEVQDPLPINNYQDKNFEIINTVTIDSSEVPLSLRDIQIAGQSQSKVKVASQLALQAQGYYYDDSFNNSGPIPPQVGQQTTYTIKWRLVNSANDLSEVQVEAFLPPHVQWLGKVSPGQADLKYHSSSGRLLWEIGSLPAASGILSPVKQVAFQVAITPGLAYLDSYVELIGQSRATGQDNFTDQLVKSFSSIIDTSLPDDPLIVGRDGRVIE